MKDTLISSDLDMFGVQTGHHDGQREFREAHVQRKTNLSTQCVPEGIAQDLPVAQLKCRPRLPHPGPVTVTPPSAIFHHTSKAAGLTG